MSETTPPRGTTILGVDVGRVRVGVAVREAGGPVRPVGSLLHAGGRAEREVVLLLDRYRPCLLVIGLPLDEAGTETAQCEHVRRFAERVRRRSSAPVHFQDEYLTSVEAWERVMRPGSDPERVRKSGKIDAVAASLILERFLSESEKTP